MRCPICKHSQASAEGTVCEMLGPVDLEEPEGVGLLGPPDLEEPVDVGLLGSDGSSGGQPADAQAVPLALDEASVQERRRGRQPQWDGDTTDEARTSEEEALTLMQLQEAAAEAAADPEPPAPSQPKATEKGKAPRCMPWQPKAEAKGTALPKTITSYLQSPPPKAAREAAGDVAVSKASAQGSA